MRAVENTFGIDTRSELCKSCIHTNVCCKDKNLFGDRFTLGHPMFFDNDELYKKFKEREKAGFPCEDYFQEVVHCKDCKHAHMTYDGECKWCDRMSELGLEDDDIYLPGDWFCADGERMSE